MNAFKRRHPAHYRGGTSMGRGSPASDEQRQQRERQRAVTGSRLLLEALCDEHGEEGRPDIAHAFSRRR
jgi:hypothetical protein